MLGYVFGKGEHGHRANEPGEMWEDFASRLSCASAPCNPSMTDGSSETSKVTLYRAALAGDVS